jgi:hypothetical protein
VRADELPKVLFPEQLAMQTDEWVGASVQTTAHCFYTESKVYRCVIFTRNQLQTSVEFANVDPDTIRNYIEHNCRSLTQMNTEYCKFSIRFVYVGSAYVSDASQYQKLLIRARELHASIGYPDKWYRDERPMVANCRDADTYKMPLEKRTNCPILTREQVDDLKPNAGENDIGEIEGRDQIRIVDEQGDENVSVPELETLPDHEDGYNATSYSELERLWEQSSLPKIRSARNRGQQ